MKIGMEAQYRKFYDRNKVADQNLRDLIDIYGDNMPWVGIRIRAKRDGIFNDGDLAEIESFHPELTEIRFRYISEIKICWYKD